MGAKTRIMVLNKGERIPFAGTVVDGTALVDESAITGVSTPALITDARGQNQVTAGGMILDGWLKIEYLDQLDNKFSCLVTTGCKSAVETQDKTRKSHHRSKLGIYAVISSIILALISAAIFAFIGYVLLHSPLVAVVCGLIGFVAGTFEACRSVF